MASHAGQQNLQLRWGYPIRTSSSLCVEFIDSYFQQVMVYGPRMNIILQAVDADEQCALANALVGLYLLNKGKDTRGRDSAHFLAAAKRLLEFSTPYESKVVRAVLTLVQGCVEEVLISHFELLKEYPRDLASLKRAQTLCFYTGRTGDMLKLALQVLPENVESAYMHGMLAFALVEVGKFTEAEKAARMALSIEEHDVWAQHALCHVFQAHRQFDKAITFMNDHSGSWTICGSFLYTHNWWHLAICQLVEGGSNSLDAVLLIYDKHVWGARGGEDKDISSVCLNAIGLLLYLDLYGFETSVNERVPDISSCLLVEKTWHKEWLLDLLTVWLLARAAKLVAAKHLLTHMNERVNDLGCSEEASRSILVVGSALYEYGVGNADMAYSLLGPCFDTRLLKVIGASDEQLRVFTVIGERMGNMISSRDILRHEPGTTKDTKRECHSVDGGLILQAV